MIPYLNRILGGLLVLALAAVAVQSIRLDRAQDYHKEYVAKIKDRLIEAYRKNDRENTAAQYTQAALDVEYQRGLNDAKKLGDAVAADLTADNERLQVRWREAIRRANAAEATTADSAGDGTSGSVSQDLAGFVQRAAEADAKIVRLQNRIDGYLKQVNGVGWYDRYSVASKPSWSSDTGAGYRSLVAESFGVRETSGNALAILTE